MKKALLLAIPCLCWLPMAAQENHLDRDGSVVAVPTQFALNAADNSTRAGTWIPLGEGTFIESFYDYVDYYFEEYMEPNSTPIPVGEELKVEFEESADVPGVYRLVNPYKNWSGINSADFSYDSLHDYYLYIDASDPDYVFMMSSESGVKAAGEMTIVHSNIEQFVNMYGMDFMLEYYPTAGGKLIDGVITLPSQIELNETYNLWINAVKLYNTSCPANATGHLEFVLPQNDNNAVTAIENADAPVEFFTLQGVKTENPQHGIFIMRQGNKAVKVVR